MKPIFEYFHYHEFLRDYYEEKKQNNPQLLWYLGYHLKLDPAFLLKVFQGKAYLSDSTLPRICLYFNFSRQQSHYFKKLIRYNNTFRPSDHHHYFSKLRRLSRSYGHFIKGAPIVSDKKWYNLFLSSFNYFL